MDKLGGGTYPWHKGNKEQRKMFNHDINIRKKVISASLPSITAQLLLSFLFGNWPKYRFVSAKFFSDCHCKKWNFTGTLFSRLNNKRLIFDRYVCVIVYCSWHLFLTEQRRKTPIDSAVFHASTVSHMKIIHSLVNKLTDFPWKTACRKYSLNIYLLRYII